MKMTIKALAFAVTGAFAIGIAGASLLGVWKTTSNKEPAKIAAGEYAGMPSPSDIRGSYSWSDVARAFNFDASLILRAFGATNPEEKINTLESIYGDAGLPAGSEIGTDSVRLFVSLLTGLPLAPETDTILPVSAIDVLKNEGKADSALIEAAAARAFVPARPVDLSDSVAAITTPAPSKIPTQETAVVSTAPSTTTTVKSGSTSEEHTTTPGTVTGRTTFKDLKEWGLSEDKIKSATEGKIGPDDVAVKDWAAANELTFSDLKTKLQELLGTK